MIDDAVPRLTAGAGLPRARAILHALADYPITLFPLWRYEEDWREVYKAVPPTVEVMLGLGIARLESFLDARRGVYDALVISRPPNLARLKALQARRPELFEGLRLIYDAEAIFATREIGQARLNGSVISEAEAARRIATEIAQAKGVDRVLVVSEADRALYTEAGFTDVRLLSHSIAPRRTAPGLREHGLSRQGLLFVGALDPNTPNEDSLLWFAKTILPHLPGATLSILGECRSAQVAALAGKQVRLHGPQEDLTPFYDSARVFIAPTRFAGGVPAKVIEAAANGLPVVATPLLISQLGWTPGTEILEAATPERFAAAITQLLTDDALWCKVQAAAWQRVAQVYDPAAFTDRVRRAVTEPTRSLAPLTRDNDGEIVC
jgi:glycosyltransferase involved in cell wall biosynthesis